jgi:hypothetical protein
MGRNAQRKRVLRDAAKNPDVPPDVRRTADQVMRRLRAHVADVATRLDFEELIARMPHPEQSRKLLTPWLRDPLPCCPSVVLELADHAPGCPAAAQARVTLQ